MLGLGGQGRRTVVGTDVGWLCGRCQALSVRDSLCLSLPGMLLPKGSCLRSMETDRPRDRGVNLLDKGG